MAKITALPGIEMLSGRERLPVVQDGETRGVTMNAFIEGVVPHLENWYRGDRGETGPANNTVATLGDLATADTSHLSATVRGIGTFTWIEGKFDALVAAQPADYRVSTVDPSGVWAREPGAAGFPSIASIEATTFQVGQVFRSSLYDGSVWRVVSRVELQPDYWGTIDGGGNNTASSVVNFTDELHVLVALADGGTGIAQCRLGSITGYLRRRVAELTAQIRSRLDQAVSLEVALTIAMAGDSITFSQFGKDGSEAANGAVARTGQATGYGDGSIHQFDQLPTTIPQYVQATGEAIYGPGKVSVSNRGYSGDRVGSAYRRHRVPHGRMLTYVGFLANEVIYATNNGQDQAGLFTATAAGTPNSYGGFVLANYAPALLKFVAREILRGSLPILWGIGPFQQIDGYDGTPFATARMMAYYMQAMREVGDKLGLIVVDGVDIGGNYPLSQIMQGDAHPNQLGAQIYGTRLFAPVLALGSTLSIGGDYTVPANIMTRPWQHRLSNGKSKVANSNSLGAPFFTATDGCDINLTDAGDEVWLGIYAQADDVAFMPVGSLQTGSVQYDVDLGLDQGGRALRTDPLAIVGAIEQIAGTKTITTVGPSLKLTTPSAEADHLIIARRGWHIVRVRRLAGSISLSGLIFFREPDRWRSLPLADGFTQFGRVKPAWCVRDGSLVFRGTVRNANTGADTRMFDIPIPANIQPVNVPGVDQLYHWSSVRTVHVGGSLYWRNNASSGAGNTNTFNLANIRIPLLDLPG